MRLSLLLFALFPLMIVGCQSFNEANGMGKPGVVPPQIEPEPRTVLLSEMAALPRSLDPALLAVAIGADDAAALRTGDDHGRHDDVGGLDPGGLADGRRVIRVVGGVEPTGHDASRHLRPAGLAKERVRGDRLAARGTGAHVRVQGRTSLALSPRAIRSYRVPAPRASERYDFASTARRASFPAGTSPIRTPSGAALRSTASRAWP